MNTALVRLAGFVLALAALAAPAWAQQDEPRFAIVASLPTPTISFQWKMSERLALRVEGSYRYTDEEFDSTSPVSVSGLGIPQTITTATHSEATSHNSSLALAGIITIHRGEQLQLYVAPRLLVSFSRQHASTATTVAGVPAGVPASLFRGLERNDTSETSSTSPGAGASFGAAANVHRRLAVFGETGVTYGRTSDSTPLLSVPTLTTFRDADSRRITFNTRAVLGVMIRF
jgi:hypothetical protein